MVYGIAQLAPAQCTTMEAAFEISVYVLYSVLHNCCITNGNK